MDVTKIGGISEEDTGPHIDRLKEMNGQIKGVFWGPKSSEMTPDQRAKYLLMVYWDIKHFGVGFDHFGHKWWHLSCFLRLFYYKKVKKFFYWIRRIKNPYK